MENKRELIKKVLNNEEAERVPFSFWHHLASPPGPRPDLFKALDSKEVYDRIIQGHIDMYKTIQPDFMKIMSDGFFGHPSLREVPINTADDLYKVKSVGPDHPWITEQVKFVKKLNDYFHDEVYTFYSVFAPLHCIRLHFTSFEGHPEKFPKFFLDNPDAMVYAANEIGKDLNYFLDQLYEQVDIDGIYYSVQQIQDPRADFEFHKKYVEPSDTSIIKTLNKYRKDNILHICGYKEFTNDLNLFTNYDCNVMNWATFTEKVDLEEGKKFFHNKIVCGGFNNNPGTLLDSGTDEEVEQHIKELLHGKDNRGVIIGADCTVNPEIPAERYRFIKEMCEKYSKK